MASQALGLAEATGFPFVEKRLAIRPPWAWLPPQLWVAPLLRARPEAGAALARSGHRLRPQRGDAGAGDPPRQRRAHALAAQIQDPRVGHGEFDLMVVPEHDRLRGPRVVVTRGAIHRVTRAKARRGARAAFPQFDGAAAADRRRADRRLEPRLSADPGAARRDRRRGSPRRCAQRGGSVAGDAVAAHRRRWASRCCASGLRGLPGEVWDDTGDNPYYAYLAVADALLVTADSVSMISEAAATGKPVHIIELDGGDAKFARFHAAMRASRDHPAVYRHARNLELRAARRHRPRRRRAARAGARALEQQAAA